MFLTDKVINKSYSSGMSRIEDEERQELISDYVDVIAASIRLVADKKEIPHLDLENLLDARSMLRQLVPDERERNDMIMSKLWDMGEK